ncbi:hypothetical protein bsdE14_31660 [Clostridium omnivorum]|uniref:Uncharacterized protein n=1 Tax=Clostridium omnivorum TaxID=1604902 RepID=A0ABQ5N9B1_9CLOT|nr:hypothetical protein bsdE14_31660 [Clostridium sp. E14]
MEMTVPKIVPAEFKSLLSDAVLMKGFRGMHTDEILSALL